MYTTDFNYRLINNNTEVEIKNYNGTGGDVVIPELIDNKPVTSIGDHAFDGCEGLTNITIPNSVTSIDDGAFFYCTGLTSVTIPDSVMSIGSSAFAYCRGLTSVTIPNSVTHISDWAFSRCINLTNITISDSVTDIGVGTFAVCTNLTSITIPNSVTNIGAYAFSRCTNLTSVSIPKSVTSISEYAFRNCIRLKTSKGYYKAFNKDLTCLGYQFKENEWSKPIDNPIFCTQGYHFCTNLFDIFNYYSGNLDKDIVIYECEVKGVSTKSRGDSKRVCQSIKPVKKLSRQDILNILNGSK